MHEGVSMGDERAPRRSRPERGRRRPATPGVPVPAGTHVPVFAARSLELLAPALTGPGAVLVDATLGLGGHAELFLSTFPELRLVGLDRDTEALRRSRERLAPFADRLDTVHAVYDRIGSALADLGLSTVDGVLFDLGVSSLQLDEPARGFAYARDAPLDMRMDQTTGRTAADVVNTEPAGELTRILREYGEERFAGRIAAAIVRERERAPITSSALLADLVRDAIPAPARRTGGNPAKRTFQALRIEVNGELSVLRAALPAAIDALRVGGRIVVLSYQSLEDRIVKRELTTRARSSAPPDLPVVPPELEPELRLLSRSSEVPDEAEAAANPRATSARLRAAERIRGGRPGARVKEGS
ncbi:16S rRNA (cytosine(1402)-N(4))-methyltransferase RsmH [Actinocatenispora rupis]|uniref:Ribosomal RNA small subunit methyltransferase H n=1 Tax=Actinocatenispora rupis TaxID=519421 RepID=A0A8J3IVE9_9ACTN|nr:16S rRNA (cytosine(1402)-N(4))-methyltransferase RsmH [Actinocatenispora rupis]GID09285.1 ribosomal RNA small subunit methyltransferase H [Actinocatenispora rupis]